MSGAALTEIVLAYSVTPGGAARPNRLRLVLRVDWRPGSTPPGQHFPGVVLMAGKERIPVTAADGVELCRWMPAQLDKPGEFELWVDPAPAREEGWHQFYCKLILLGGGGRNLVIHPNTCRAFRVDGQPIRAPAPPAPLRYEPAAPRTLVCPTCFDEFPVNRMKFAFNAKGPPVSGSGSLLGRFRPSGQLAVPVDREGRRAIYRFCPNMHRLPSSAGTQSSLVVGLIGAKYSGKTHYIGSLIHGLRNRSAIENGLAVLAADDVTDERFRTEFETPLFEQKKQLDATVGEPAPLIYDVSCTVADQVRRVTLSRLRPAPLDLPRPRALLEISRGSVRFQG